MATDLKMAQSFAYEVAYGEPSMTGEAQVTYTNADGEDVTETVTMPWTSAPITVSDRRSYRIEASAPARDDATLKCGINAEAALVAGIAEGRIVVETLTATDWHNLSRLEALALLPTLHQPSVGHACRQQQQGTTRFPIGFQASFTARIPLPRHLVHTVS